MKKPSYLLALDGTSESRAAAYLAWNLAHKTGARVVAQHVINAKDIWRFLRPRSAGFIGSGLYVEAFEHVTKGLRSIGEALMMSYNAQVEGQNIDSVTYIDEGDLVSQICKRAQESDLLIIGHRPSTLPSKETDNTYSLCEELIEVCPCPMLIVTASCPNLNKLRLRLFTGQTDARSIESLNKFVHSLDLPVLIELSSSIPVKELDKLKKQLLTTGAQNNEFFPNDSQKDSSSSNEMLAMISSYNQTKQSKNELFSHMNNLLQPATLIWR